MTTCSSAAAGLLPATCRLVSVEHAPGPEPRLPAVPDHRPGQQRRPALGLADGYPGALHPPMINSNVTEGDRGARNGYVVPAAAEWGGYAVLAVTR